MTANNPSPTGGGRRTAHDLRHRFEWLNQFSDDELRDIAYCDENEPLQDGGQYFDISNPERGLIVGHRGEASPPGACYVWREGVSSETWNKLVSYGRARQAGR